jgi:mannose-6-phosphate isomerase-like protein (cupin superfamily)
MRGFNINLEQKTLTNEYFREVLFTTERSQLVVMALQPGEDIGMEVHAEHDQFIRIEVGQGQALIDEDKFSLEDGSAVVIPAGVKHNIINTGQGAMKLYTIYTPPEHAADRVDVSKPEK